jgi:transposase
MDGLFWLSPGQLNRIKPCFPLSHGVPRADDRKVVSGIIYVIRNGLQWRDAPTAYGPHKTLYNRFIRWSRMGVFNCIRLHGIDDRRADDDLLPIGGLLLAGRRLGLKTLSPTRNCFCFIFFVIHEAKAPLPDDLFSYRILAL